MALVKVAADQTERLMRVQEMHKYCPDQMVNIFNDARVV
jgi:hypothetical protein